MSDRWGPLQALAAVSRAAPALRGKPNLAWRLMRASERRGSLGGTWHVRLKDGTRLELPRESRMAWAVAFSGLYDRAAVEQVEGFIAPGTLALDVGASIGLWTVQLGAIAAGRAARVWAFEPNPANTPWIRRNLALNDLQEAVEVRELGLGDVSETSTLVGAEYGVGNGAIALMERPSTDKHPRITVTLARLDDIDLPARVSFIKIDVEGYEVAFLRGAAGVIARDRPVIFGEFSSGWIERRGEDLRAALRELDYEITALAWSHPRHAWSLPGAIAPRPVDLASSEPLPTNLLLRPRGGPAA